MNNYSRRGYPLIIICRVRIFSMGERCMGPCENDISSALRWWLCLRRFGIGTIRKYDRGDAIHYAILPDTPTVRAFDGITTTSSIYVSFW
jgi:hypothetical protein